MNGCERITAERQRQMEIGWSASHDDSHAEGELAIAAACYAAASAASDAGGDPCPVPSVYVFRDANGGDAWPWEEDADKRPRLDASVPDRVRALEKAGALIAAEIDRLLRCGGA